MIMTPVKPIPSERLVYSHRLTGAGMWSQVIRKGRILRLTDCEGGANVGMLLYNADEKQERYNMPDTLKGQHIFYLSHPYCIHSDMGRLFCSIVNDTAGWHDTVCGCSDAELVEAKYGAGSYQEMRNEFFRNGRDCFLIELSKWGLGERDLVPNLNLFSRIVADEQGNLEYVEGHSKPEAMIELRFEMNTLVVLNTCAHPLNPDSEYRSKPVKLEVYEGDPVASDDPCLISRPENKRAFENTETYNRLRF